MPSDSGTKALVVGLPPTLSDSLRLYSDWGDFYADLVDSLDGATKARSMYAHGHFDADSNTFTAAKLGILLLEP